MDRKEFPKIRIPDISIPLKPAYKPVVQGEKRIALALEEAIGEELKHLEEKGITEKVTTFSPWVSSIVPVPKKSKGVRICLDLRDVNASVQKEIHPIPTAEQLFAKLNGTQRFTILDVENASLQLPPDEAARQLTTFRTHKGQRIIPLHESSFRFFERRRDFSTYNGEYFGWH